MNPRTDPRLRSVSQGSIPGFVIALIVVSVAIAVCYGVALGGIALLRMGAHK